MLRRLITGLTAAIAALAVGASLASAGTIVDDYWRDSLVNVKATPAASDRIVDDYFRDAQPSVKGTPAAASDRIVDDYFRDASAAVVTGSGFDWGDFSIGIVVGVGSLLMLAGLGAGALAAREHRVKKARPAATG